MKNRNYSALIKKIKESEVEFFAFLVPDLKGRLRQLVLPAAAVNEELLENGVGFDGSSYGFAKTENSDMVLLPDTDTFFIDPFIQRKTGVVFGNIHLTDSQRSPYQNDCRYIARKAEEYLSASNFANQALFGPEFEFFIFSEFEFHISDQRVHLHLKKESEENRNFYHSSIAEDHFADFRNEAVAILVSLGVDVKYHHHEVAANQHEIETTFNPLLRSADQSMLVKYVLFNLARRYNLFVTFMPKPFAGKAGNGWHVHQYLLHKGKNIFYDQSGYANLSREALSYIAGILLHAQGLCAFSNPSTNSYKRFVKGFEAPVATIFARSNRAAAVRIPAYTSPDETRMEYRSGDATANPYLFLAAMLLAGIDGIEKNLLPEKYNFGPFEGNLENHPQKKKIKELPRSLDEALNFLEKDYEYLLKGNVFNEDLIQRWIMLKQQESDQVNTLPHPKEFELYFNL